jgi:RNA polymerase sigma factor (sigma-70 family)
MAEHTLNHVISEMHRWAASDLDAAPDAELLRRFNESRNGAAFELLVWRHGSLVLGVSRRILGPGPDAEDAFQATFLALVRRAPRVRAEPSLAGWLHRVARNASLRARKQAARRARVEQQAALPNPSAAGPAVSDLWPVLDEEIGRLPEPFRIAFVLCHLQGKTNEEAARLLGCPKGTVVSRLWRARKRLRVRLMRRGITLAAGGLTFALDENGVSAALVNSAMRNALAWANGPVAAGTIAPAVTALTEGVLNSMFLGKLKVAAGAMLVACALAASGTLLMPDTFLRAQPGDEPLQKSSAGQPAPKEPDSPLDPILGKAGPRKHADAQQFLGTWKVTGIVERGATVQDPGDVRFTFGPTSARIDDAKDPASPMTISYRLDPEEHGIDLTFGTKTLLGIYQFHGQDELELAINPQTGPRPSAFGPTKELKETTVFRMRRVVAAKPKKVGRGDLEPLPDADSLPRENQRLVEALKAAQVKQQEYEQRIAEMQRLAQREYDRAVDMERKVQQQLQRAVENARHREEDRLKEKDKEIELLRAKIPVDKWDAGWSEVTAQFSAWGIRILSDGSGIYGYGRQFQDFCTFPAETFDFGKVRRDLLAEARLDSEGAACEITLRRKKENGAIMVFSKDAPYVQKLIQTAHEKASNPAIDLRWPKSGDLKRLNAEPAKP